jgi:hypothetical protein
MLKSDALGQLGYPGAQPQCNANHRNMTANEKKKKKKEEDHFKG